MQANTADARGLTFECLPGCGFCCTASPLVLPHEAPALGARVVTAPDGALRIPVQGLACGALRADRGCGVYHERPSVCHLYPYQVHAGRRIQVSVTLACPGVQPRHAADPDTEGDPIEHPFGVDGDAESGARRAVELALAQPGAPETAARAKETLAEYDRRMKEWGVAAPPDKLRAAFTPHLVALARPEALPAFFAGLGEGDLTLGKDPARDAARLFDAEPDAGLDEWLDQAARDAFADQEDALWVEPEFAWAVPRLRDGRVEVRRVAPDGAERATTHAPADVPADWSEDASRVLAAYLDRVARRDHAEAAAAWVVDASGYQATPASAFGRVLAEASLQVALRAGLAAADEGATEIDARLAWRGIRAYETSFHSLPTLGAIL